MRSACGQIEGVGDGSQYQRLYIPSRVSSDSTFPFRPGDDFRLEIVTTECDREILVVTSDALEVDLEETAVELSRSSREVQTELAEELREDS